MKIQLRNEVIILDKERGIYFPAHHTLVISDLHLGKSAYFRKQGIPVPNNISLDDLKRLDYLIEKYTPTTLLINGDMFHYELNEDIESFKIWRRNNPTLTIILVEGNHDLLANDKYKEMQIITLLAYTMGNFSFHHAYNELLVNTHKFSFFGHLHPGISLVGRAKQRLKFPCFYTEENYAILPAFSLFTGLSMVKPSKDATIYAITPEKVVKIS